VITPTNAADMRIQLDMRPSSLGFTAISKGIRGADLTPAEDAAFREMSGGVAPRPGVGFVDVLVIKPRRAGGTEWGGGEAAYEAAYVPHAAMAAPGQTLVFPIVCPRLDQSREMLSYVRGFARQPGLASLVSKITDDEVLFTTGVAVRIITADVNAVSGVTSAGYLLSEFAKLPGDDSAQSDKVIVDSLDPATLPIIGAPPRRRLRESSAYVQDGLCYEMERDYWGKEDAPTLVLRGCFRLLNPSIDRDFLARERRRLSSAVYAREYGFDFDSPPIFQSSVTESWFGADTIDKCVDEGRGILEPNPQLSYFAGIDLGVRQDAAALAIGHRERIEGEPVTVVDGCWSWAAGSKSLGEIVQESAAIIRRYRARAWADQWAFDSVKDGYAREQVIVTEAPWTSMGEKNKANRFNRVKYEMRDRRVRLPGANSALIREFHNLGGKLLRSGTEQLAARRGGDDLVHATVLMLSEALEHAPDRKPSFAHWSISEYLEKEREFFQNQRRLPARFYHPIFDRYGMHLDYRTAMQMAKDGTL
jgi:hypothetical protein